MSDDEEKKYRPPTSNKADVAHAVARAGLGVIPIAGTASIELLSAIVTPSIEKRRDQWMQEIGEGLRQLERDVGVVLENLQEHEAFIDLALEASQIAIRTSNREKREALRNAVLNTALPEAPEESMQKMLLTFVDTLSAVHLKLLVLFNDPQGFVNAHQSNFGNISMGAASHLVEAAYPELRGERHIYDPVWKDLYSRALVNTESLHMMMTGMGILERRTTAIGEMLVEFIRSPLPSDA